jgi:protein involved in polysaccharide export with SLBB domain
MMFGHNRPGLLDVLASIFLTANGNMMARTDTLRCLCGLAVLLPLVTGCAAFRPIKGVPARYLPDDFRGETRSGKKTIDLSLLRQTPPTAHRVDTGDVLAIYIEGVLNRTSEAGRPADPPPVYFPPNNDLPPTVGYPFPVREDGTISLPLVGPLDVRGLTMVEVEQKIKWAYTQQPDRQLLQPGRDRIIVQLQRPRTFRVLVIRQESTTDMQAGQAGQLNIGMLKRGTGKAVNLPVYKNDVLNALAETGGLPGLDAENAIYIIRNQSGRGTGGVPTAMHSSAPPTRSSLRLTDTHRHHTLPNERPIIRAQSPGWSPPGGVDPHTNYRSSAGPIGPGGFSSPPGLQGGQGALPGGDNGYRYGYPANPGAAASAGNEYGGAGLSPVPDPQVPPVGADRSLLFGPPIPQLPPSPQSTGLLPPGSSPSPMGGALPPTGTPGYDMMSPQGTSWPVAPPTTPMPSGPSDPGSTYPGSTYPGSTYPGSMHPAPMNPGALHGGSPQGPGSWNAAPPSTLPNPAMMSPYPPTPSASTPYPSPSGSPLPYEMNPPSNAADMSWQGMPLPADGVGALHGIDMGQSLEGRRVIRIPVRLGHGEFADINEADIILHDGDIVFIESRETEVFYTGGLLGGGQFTLPRDYDLDILEAIAVAQGQRQGGGGGGGSRATSSIGGQSALNNDVSISASQAIVKRKLPDGTEVRISINLYQALRDPAERVIIQPGDYILLQYTRMEAIGAFIERHLLEGALFGVAATQLNNGGN